MTKPIEHIEALLKEISPWPWNINDRLETVKLLDKNGDFFLTLTWLNKFGRRSAEEVIANSEFISNAPMDRDWETEVSVFI